MYRLTERDSRLADYFELFWGLRLLLGCLASSGAKYLTSYSCSPIQISYKGDEISRVSRAVSENWCGTDRQTDRQTVCEPN